MMLGNKSNIKLNLLNNTIHLNENNAIFMAFKVNNFYNQYWNQTFIFSFTEYKERRGDLVRCLSKEGHVHLVLLYCIIIIMHFIGLNHIMWHRYFFIWHKRGIWHSGNITFWGWIFPYSPVTGHELYYCLSQIILWISLCKKPWMCKY